MNDIERDILAYSKRKRQRKMDMRPPAGYVPLKRWSEIHGMTYQQAYHLAQKRQIRTIKIGNKYFVGE